MADEPTPPADVPAGAPPQAETAQIPVNEPLSEPIPEPTPQAEASAPSEPAQPVSEVAQEPSPTPAEQTQSEPPEIPEVEAPKPQAAATAAQSVPANPALNTSPQAARELLVKARAKVQTQKQKKLDKIMVETEKHGKITNDEVEKLLRCSDATASRYLSALEKQGKIKKVGTTGAGVVYVKA